MITTVACSLGLHRECCKKANTSNHANPTPEEQAPCECPCHTRKKRSKK